MNTGRFHSQMKCANLWTIETAHRIIKYTLTKSCWTVGAKIKQQEVCKFFAVINILPNF